MSGWCRADPSHSVGSMGATDGNSRLSATFCGTNAKSPAKPPRPPAPTAAPSLRGQRHGTVTCSTTNASSGGTPKERGKDSRKEAGRGKAERQKTGRRERLRREGTRAADHSNFQSREARSRFRSALYRLRPVARTWACALGLRRQRPCFGSSSGLTAYYHSALYLHLTPGKHLWERVWL